MLIPSPVCRTPLEDPDTSTPAPQTAQTPFPSELPQFIPQSHPAPPSPPPPPSSQSHALARPPASAKRSDRGCSSRARRPRRTLPACSTGKSRRPDLCSLCRTRPTSLHHGLPRHSFLSHLFLLDRTQEKPLNCLFSEAPSPLLRDLISPATSPMARSSSEGPSRRPHITIQSPLSRADPTRTPNTDSFRPGLESRWRNGFNPERGSWDGAVTPPMCLIAPAARRRGGRSGWSTVFGRRQADAKHLLGEAAWVCQSVYTANGHP